MMLPCAGHPGGGSAPAFYFSEFVEGRRGQILDAALAVFAEKGYEAGTMREIAARVGVTEPALYRHYAGKEALFEDLVAVAGDHIAERASARMQLVRPETIRDSLAVIMESRRRPHEQDGARPVIGILMMAAPHNGAFREVFRQHILEPMVREVSAILPSVDAYHGISRSPEEVAARVRAFISLFVGSFLTSMMFGDSGEHADDVTVDAMMAMMGWDRPAE
jgi:AcrR family transcriptional regulator